jgi:hypothetical protein
MWWTALHISELPTDLSKLLGKCSISPKYGLKNAQEAPRTLILARSNDISISLTWECPSVEEGDGPGFFGDTADRFWKPLVSSCP